MFGSSGNRSRRSLRRGRKIGKRRGIGRGSRLHGLNLEPILKIGGIVAGAAALVVLIIFVIIPLFSGKHNPSTSASSGASSSSSPTATVQVVAEELKNTPETVTDPYLYISGDKSEFVFSTGDSASNPDTISIYDIKGQQPSKVSGITEKWDGGLFEPKINDKYIVYLDCKSKDGGSVCGYDISSGTSFVMRDYIYGKPKVSLSGKYALWLQQTGPNSDKLYLFDLETKECATIEVFSNITKMFISAPYMSGDSIIYMQPEGESQLLDGSADTDKVQICILPLKDKGDTAPIQTVPGIYVYEPMIAGDNIVFLDGNRDQSCHLMYMKKNSDNTFTQPVAIAQGVLNYCLGDGFVAYTLNDVVYAYYFADGSTRTLSQAGTTRSLLCSASGKEVIWYDTTDGSIDVADVIMHVQLP